VDHGTTILVSTHYMDEAERCHGLSIFHEGVLVEHGTPRELAARVAATVVEIEAEEIRAARAALDGLPQVLSVAQLGARLHALVDLDARDPEALLRGALAAAGVAAQVERARPSLEDVFVAATGSHHMRATFARILAIVHKEVLQLLRDRPPSGWWSASR
jgi:ABC-2 type transport system ATP-binding protein